MQDTFARARTRPLGQARDDRVYCIQYYTQLALAFPVYRVWQGQTKKLINKADF